MQTITKTKSIHLFLETPLYVNGESLASKLSPKDINLINLAYKELSAKGNKILVSTDKKSGYKKLTLTLVENTHFLK